MYINRKIVDIGYYRNWRDKDLFYQAIAIAAFYGDCKSKEEYNERMFGTKEIIHVLEPETIESAEENLKWLESLSEFPIIVDLSEKYIYASYDGILSEEALKDKSTVKDDRKNICSKKVWRKIRPEKGDYLDHIRNGSFYDNGYGYIDIAIQRICASSPDEDFAAILRKCKISFEEWNIEAIRKIILKWDAAVYHMSKTLLSSIKHPAYIRYLDETS